MTARDQSVGAPERPLRVLHVDDPEVLTAVGEHVERKCDGLTHCGVSSQVAAMDALLATQPDCLVVDSQLPGVDARSLMETCRRPVVLFTAADPTSIDEATLAAADTLIENAGTPRSRAFLIEKVESLTRRAPAAGGGPTAGRSQTRTLADDRPDGTGASGQFLVEPDGTVVWASDPFESVFPIDAVDGPVPESRNLYDRLTALLRDAPSAVATVQRFERTDDPESTATFTLPTADGPVRFRHTGHALPDAAGDLRLEVFEDVTPAARREVRLDLLELLVEQAQDGLYTLDASGVVDFCNDSFAAMLGYEREELIGRHAAEVLADGELRRGQDLVQALREDPDRDSARLDLTFLDRDGQRLEVSVHFTLLPPEDDGRAGNGDGEYAGLMGVARDVTERERQRRELDLLREVFARVLRHDLRSELSVVMCNAAEVAARTDGETAELARTIVDRAEVLAETARKARTIEQVLESDAEPTTQNVRNVVVLAVRAVSNRHPEAEYETDVPDDVAVRAHPELAQAVEALVENGVVHAEEDRPRVRVAVGCEEDRVAVRVIDRGPGIPAVEREVIERATETPLKHSSGLGLWLVNWIVDRSGGELSFDRADGETVVTIRLDRA